MEPGRFCLSLSGHHSKGSSILTSSSPAAMSYGGTKEDQELSSQWPQGNHDPKATVVL